MKINIICHICLLLLLLQLLLIQTFLLNDCVASSLFPRLLEFSTKLKYTKQIKLGASQFFFVFLSIVKNIEQLFHHILSQIKS